MWLCCLCPLSDFISHHSSRVPNGNCKVIHLINVLNKWMKPRSWVCITSINQSRWHLLKSHSLPDANRIVERGLAWSYWGILFQHAALWPHSSVWVSVCLSLPLGLKWRRMGVISGIKQVLHLPTHKQALLQFLESLADNIECWDYTLISNNITFFSAIWRLLKNRRAFLKPTLKWNLLHNKGSFSSSCSCVGISCVVWLTGAWACSSRSPVVLYLNVHQHPLEKVSSTKPKCLKDTSRWYWRIIKLENP